MNDLERKEALEARKEALERELKRRVVESLSTSERQARYITGRDVLVVDAEDRDDERERGVWGVRDDERPELDGDSASRRQAARLTRGASSRGGA